MTRTIAQLLRDSTVLHPDRIAVEDSEHGNGITYRELSSRAREARDALLRHGLGAGDRVGLLAPKSIGRVAAIFGVLDAGAAYVPVDPAAPPPRNAAILTDCSISYAIVSVTLFESLSKVWTGEPLQVAQTMGDDLLLVTVGAKGEDDRGRIDILADPVAYVLYTSGSTGQPKGVVHTQSSALSFIDWCSATFAPTEQDRFSSHAPFHFDLSIFDLYVPIKHGATVVLIGTETGKQPKPLASLISEQRLTVWYSTPSVLRVLTEYGRLDELDCSALRFVLFAGEVFPVRHLRALKKLWAAPRYFNLYGPTETNVCTAYELPADIPDDRTEPYPIGFPCSGDRAMAVDENDLEVELGAEGELVISGASVMREYWNLPERTSESFFVDQSGVKW
jgi:amino acid adenylation domain-containing protein